MTRFLMGAALVLLAGAAPVVRAQNPLSGLRDDSRPEYLEGLLPHTPTAIRIPPPPPGLTPLSVRGIYVNSWAFGSARLDGLIRLADTTEINAFVIDVKDGTGYMTYRSAVPIANEIGANNDPRATDVRARLALLRQHDIYPIARIVVGKDPLLADGRPGWAVTDSRGGLWEDRIGHRWVDAYNDSVWVYAADIAVEAIMLGFAEVQFDYVRFPDEPQERMQYAVFGAAREGLTRRAAIRRHLSYLRDRISAMDVPLSIDVFGMTTSASSGMGIGQYWEDFIDVVDVVLPMVYPSHYGRGSYGIVFPNAEPYETVKRALEPAIRRSAPFENPARIRPFLQSFSIRGVRYTAHEMREQIRAVEDLGLTDWVFWSARGAYPAAAFRPAAITIATDGEPIPDLGPPRD